MAGSLQDQLLGAGLIKKQKAKNINTAKKKAVKQSRANNTQLVNEAAELAKKAQNELRQKSQQLNEQHKKASEDKAVMAQIRQIIKLNSIAKSPKKMNEDSLQAYNFTSDKKIKTLYVSPQNHDLISRGKIAISKLIDGKQEVYTLIPAEAARKISERNSDTIVLLNEKDTNMTEDDASDPYAEFEVPDDLMW